MKNNKVVYRHRNAETFQVFYIGIGNKRRPYKRGVIITLKYLEI